MSPETSTRDALLSAAAAEIVAAGYAGASLAKIASRVGYTKGSLAYHFPTKESLLVALVEHVRKVDEYCHARAARAFPGRPSRQLIGYIASYSFLGSVDPVTAAAATIPVDPSIPLVYAIECHLVWEARMTGYFEQAAVLEGYAISAAPPEATRRLLTTTSGDEIMSRFYEESMERPRISQLEPCLESLGIYDAALAIAEVRAEDFFYTTGIK